ncbi:MAG: adenylate kinase [Firmicutes bacterium]|nr:adenylate kinase [Bacillota bacterium]
MKIILLGPPGAGKGTQAQIICDTFKLAHISTGDMLRSAIQKQTETGLKAKEFMDQGALVPDDVVIALVRERVQEADCENGYILDGFPRTVEQAKALESIATIDAVIDINLPDDFLIERLSGRRVCPMCGRSYHTELLAGKTTCEDDGTTLVQRDDDKRETVLSRLKVYYQKTAPLIEYYSAKGIVHAVDGTQYYKILGETIAKELRSLQ